MKRVSILAGSVLLLSSLANADDGQLKNKLADKFFQEYSECGSYFFVMSDYLQKAGKMTEAMQYQQAYSISADLSTWAAQQGGDSEDGAFKATSESIQKYTDAIQKEAKADYSNAQNVVDKYSKHCQAIIEDPENYIKQETAKQ